VITTEIRVFNIWVCCPNITEIPDDIISIIMKESEMRKFGLITVLLAACVCFGTNVPLPNPSFEYPEVPDGSSYVELYGTGSDWEMYSDYGGLDRIYENPSAGTIDGDQCLYFNYQSHAATVTNEVIEADKLYTVNWWLRPLTGDSTRLDTWWVVRFWAYSDDNDPRGSKTKVGEIPRNEYYEDFVWEQKEAVWDTTGLDSEYVGQKLIISYMLKQGWSDDFTVTKTIPEPATIAMLGIGGLALIRRKRRA
jgi:hypothetical protein